MGSVKTQASKQHTVVVGARMRVERDLTGSFSVWPLTYGPTQVPFRGLLTFALLTLTMQMGMGLVWTVWLSLEINFITPAPSRVPCPKFMDE